MWFSRFPRVLIIVVFMRKLGVPRFGKKVFRKPIGLNFPVTAGIRYANGAQKCVSRRKDWPPWHSGSALPW
ncbi:MAG: hypothetical protein EBU89_05835 [Actinobacteria bacterium]|nr:hypothetical protein [Actinomycetota bacterium]